MSEFTFIQDYPELEEEYDFKSKILQLRDVNFVVTHGGCSDGFFSRVIIEKAMRDNPENFKNKIDDVKFVDGYYSTNNYSGLIEQMSGKNVLICDFSFKPDVFNKMIEATNSNILILDHHKTAKADLDNIDPKYKVFDMNHSGAFITYTYVNGFHNIPKVVLYVEDNDLWNKKLPFTNEFTAFMFLQPFEYDSYVKFYDDDYFYNACKIGEYCVLQNRHHIDNILKSTEVSLMEIKNRYYFVAHVNCVGILISELGNTSMKKFINANFTALYKQNIKFGNTLFSLRSLDDRSDTSSIAKLFGGGGHRNASGFTVQDLVSHVPGKIIDEFRVYNSLSNVYSRTFGDKHVLFLNTCNLKTIFAKYLMQERFDENDNVPESKNQSQEGMFIMRNNTDNKSLNVSYFCSVTWKYDGNKNRFHLVVCPLASMINAVESALKKLCTELNTGLSENENHNLNNNVNHNANNNANHNENLEPLNFRPNKNIFYIDFANDHNMSNVEMFISRLIDKV